MAVPTRTLNTGFEIPVLGFGTWRIPASDVTRIVKDAIDVGYRHIDCADSYGNQKDVGNAIEEKIAEGMVSRKDFFITGKLWNTKHDPKLVATACKNALQMLKITYFDNYLIHWPTGFVDSEENYPTGEDCEVLFSDVDYVDTWVAMEDLVKAGLCRSIGLSNFNIDQIKRVLEVANIRPANLQVECHPYLNQYRLMEFCHEHGIVLTAYSPLGSPHSPYAKPGLHKLIAHPVIVELSQKHETSPAMVLLRYQVQRGNVVITMSTRRERMAANLKICDLQLTDEDLLEINRLNSDGRYNIMDKATGHPHHPFGLVRK